MNPNVQALLETMKQQQLQFMEKLSNLTKTEPAVAQSVNAPPKFESFDKATEKWDQYLMRFKQHLDLHNATDPGKKRAFLLSCLDPDTFSLLRNLFGFTDVTGQPFDDLIDKLSAHLKSSTHVQAARYSFYKCTMQPDQLYPEWVASLRGIAKDCTFVCKSEACHHCSYVDEQLREVIIQNTPHAEIRRQCLIEPNISLNDVMKKAILYMRTLETHQLFTGSSTTAVNKMTSQYKKKPQRRSFAKNFQSTRSEWKRCQDCFKIHQPNDCPHKSSTCYKCKK